MGIGIWGILFLSCPKIFKSNWVGNINLLCLLTAVPNKWELQQWLLINNAFMASFAQFMNQVYFFSVKMLSKLFNREIHIGKIDHK